MNVAFEITDKPAWRGDDSSNIPSVKQMLNDIVDYIKIWEKFSKETDLEKLHEKLREIKLQYLVHTQTGEDIGVQTYEDTKVIIETIDSEVRCLTNKGIKTRSFACNKKSGITMCEKKFLKEKADEENISPTKKMVKNYFTGNSFSDKEKETMNLYEGLKHLEKMIDNENCNTTAEKEKLDKLLDVKESIQDLHKILTTGLLPKHLTPGEFSTHVRGAGSGNEMHLYPYFPKQMFGEAAVQSIIDAYNRQLDNIKPKLRTEVTTGYLEIIFKVAASFLFSFTGMHPFPDGNGRVARLLCSHILELSCPFPTPIYNVFSPTSRRDYIDTMRKAEQDINSNICVDTEDEAINIAHKYLEAAPSDLCAMIIESNWYTWRKLLDFET